MPTYEFTCTDCQHHFEVFTSISKKNSIACPKCEGRKLRESYGAFFVGGNLSNPSAGSGSSCDGSCATCGNSCKP
jgi:putative FmdB family regulatory protein